MDSLKLSAKADGEYYEEKSLHNATKYVVATAVTGTSKANCISKLSGGTAVQVEAAKSAKKDDIIGGSFSTNANTGVVTLAASTVYVIKD